jgi:hypothetical protein
MMPTRVRHTIITLASLDGCTIGFRDAPVPLFLASDWAGGRAQRRYADLTPKGGLLL